MAVAGQSTRHQDAIYAALEGLQNQQAVQLTGAGQLHHFDGGWILHAQAPGQIGGSVGAMFATKGDYLQLAFVYHNHFPYRRLGIGD